MLLQKGFQLARQLQTDRLALDAFVRTGSDAGIGFLRVVENREKLVGFVRVIGPIAHASQWLRGQMRLDCSQSHSLGRHHGNVFIGGPFVW